MDFTNRISQLNAIIDELMDLDQRTEGEETRYRNALQIRAILMLK